ncbi:hypothetical protein CASFOL_007497 [Castilleja foliolosa]|uniref:Uncharacterized protein n=1 Tax=Castilleja foliolosa TaxID=1961234 RepID=A0ABD3EDJ9_9LAMI
MSSPMNRHIRSGSTGISNMRKPQNTKAAAQRLARVMAHQSADDDDEEDDLLYDFDSAAPSTGIGLAGGRNARTRSPLSVRRSVEQPPKSIPVSVARPSAASSNSVDQPLSARSTSHLRPAQPKPVETPPPIHSSIAAARSSQPVDYAEEAQPPSSTRANAGGQSPSFSSTIEQPSSARLIGRPNLKVIKTAAMVPPTVPLSVKPIHGMSAPDSQPDKGRDKRLSLDFGTFKYKEPSGQQQSSSALQDELDMLQEENDSLLEKLRIAEERYEESESRTRQLEKQIASLGEGVSLEARLLSRKEAEIQKREAALKAATETYGGSSDEIATLRMEIETARDEATAALEQLHGVESEVKSLRITTQRMILTQEEMSQRFRKRLFSRGVGSQGAGVYAFATRILADISGARYEYWSSLASRPVEVILAAGKKAKDEKYSQTNNDLEERENVLNAADEISNRPNVESMLLVERGLRELTSLKVEEAIAISMAQKRRPTLVKSSLTDELRLPIEGQNFAEAFELSPDEAEDVLLKQAWLLYIWRRAKNLGLEPDIAEERLQAWITQANKQPNSQDAVDGSVTTKVVIRESRHQDLIRILYDPVLSFDDERVFARTVRDETTRLRAKVF